MQDFPRRRSAGPPVRTCSSPDTLPAIMLCRSNSTANLPAVLALRLPIRSAKERGFKPVTMGNYSSTSTSVENRSEERRVGEEGRSRWAPDHLKKKKKKKSVGVL